MKASRALLVLSVAILTSCAYAGSIGATARIWQPLSVNSDRDNISTEVDTFYGGAFSYKLSDYTLSASLMTAPFTDTAKSGTSLDGRFTQTDIGVFRDFLQTDESAIGGISLYLGYRQADSTSLQEDSQASRNRYREVDATVNCAVLGASLYSLPPDGGLGFYMGAYWAIGLTSSVSDWYDENGIRWIPGGMQLQGELGLQKLIAQRYVVRVGYMFENVTMLFTPMHMLSASVGASF